MLLKYTTLPLFVTITSILSFLLFKRYDPINLADYQDAVGGIPPIAVCLMSLLPLVVLFCYDVVLKFGPKPAKVGIK